MQRCPYLTEMRERFWTRSTNNGNDKKATDDEGTDDLLKSVAMTTKNKQSTIARWLRTVCIKWNFEWFEIFNSHLTGWPNLNPTIRTRRHPCCPQIRPCHRCRHPLHQSRSWLRWVTFSSLSLSPSNQGNGVAEVVRRRFSAMANTYSRSRSRNTVALFHKQNHAPTQKIKEDGSHFYPVWDVLHQIFRVPVGRYTTIRTLLGMRWCQV